MSKYDKVYEEISDKILNSLRKNLNGEKVRYSCPKCGFVIPKYKGKYPRYCPLCGDYVDMNKYTLTKSWTQCGLQVDMDPFGDKMEPNDIDFNAKLNMGMIKGLGRGMNGDKVKKKCGKCGFVMPKYAGRYPTYCPACGENMNPDNPVMEQEELRKNAEQMNVLIEAEKGPERLLKNPDDLAMAKEYAKAAKKGCGKAMNSLSTLLNDENDTAIFVRETIG